MLSFFISSTEVWLVKRKSKYFSRQNVLLKRVGRIVFIYRILNILYNLNIVKIRLLYRLYWAKRWYLHHLASENWRLCCNWIVFYLERKLLNCVYPETCFPSRKIINVQHWALNLHHFALKIYEIVLA